MLRGGEHPKFLIFLILAPILWGGNFVVGSVMANDLPGHWTNFLRWVIALVVLAPFCLPAVWQHRALLLRHWKRLAVTALLGVTLFNTVLYIALQTATVSIAAVAFAVTPFMISGLQALIHRELPSARFVGGAAIALMGMALAQWEALHSGTPFLGVALVLVAALIWSGFCVSLKQFSVPVPCHASFFSQIAIGTV
ncbi:MAG: DMT family transporter, partial [Halioglobus sp.]|nr:DMT family transporter [Halioglobus sp.]